MDPIVRAADVGYGHVKWTEGRNADRHILVDSFPSRAVPANADRAKVNSNDSTIFARNDTFIVPAGNHLYEVGKDIAQSTVSNAISENLSTAFSMANDYTARLYGALNYMRRSLPASRIDHLVLGLPMNTIFDYQKPLAEKFTGPHVISASGHTIEIGACHVFPQPLGSYALFLAHSGGKYGKEPNVLVVDPGYNTVDWFVCKGMVVNRDASDAVPRGVSAMLTAMAKEVISVMSGNATEPGTKRRIDEALKSRADTFKIASKTFTTADLLSTAAPICKQAVDAVKNSVGAGEDIDVVVVTGGGACFYIDAVRAAFPAHDVILLPDSAHANARGFHILGEKVARSAQRAKAAAGVSV